MHQCLIQLSGLQSVCHLPCEHSGKRGVGGESIVINTLKTAIDNQVFVGQFSPNHIEHGGFPILPRPVDGEILACVYHTLHRLKAFGGVHHVVPFGIAAAGYIEFLPHNYALYLSPAKIHFFCIRIY